MTAQLCVDPGQKRRFLREMTGIVANALDKLPVEYRLPLWLSCDAGLTTEDVAGILSVSRRELYAMRSRGMRDLLRGLEDEGIFTDEQSVMKTIGVLPVQPAPASLSQKIEKIAATADPACASRQARFPAGGRARTTRAGTRRDDV